MKADSSANFKQSTLVPWIELRVATQSSACYEAHSHDEFSFGIINQGTANYYNRGVSHRIGRGDVVTINPSDVHSCNPNLGSWSYNMLFVDTLKMGELQQEVLHSRGQSSSFDYLPFVGDLERHSLIKQQFQSLFMSLRQERDLLQTQNHLFAFVETTLGSVSFDTNENVLAPLSRVRDKLLDEIDASHQLETLATEVGLSRYQLLRMFKRHFGMTPHAYVMDEKIKRAKVMLKRGQGISDIAHQLGFSDQAHFQRHFKKVLTVTPKYYQSHFVMDR
ncbi:AraC family transcriptional regulator [Vibrio sinensis]|uniref:AraC family transcriptional regulator n=1 Tax=Vibrio sinensis TaxID=2302434 RepID=A0A3A6QAC9_9VIBR|nr:AraC family transcriptional regulator [Vibrio sinensis]RJX64846.1 AraC family transcriptional regulator [Vibrio sinensis]